MAAVAPQPAMTTIQLAVPPGAQPGQLIQAQVNGQTVQAQIPAGLQPGATFSVQIPAATQQANDAAALAAYDALLAGAGRLTFRPKKRTGPSDVRPDGTYAKGFDVDTDRQKGAFEVTYDGLPGWGVQEIYGKYEARIVIGGVAQTISSAGGPPPPGIICSGQLQLRPAASQSMDRGEALTVQLERPSECDKYKKCICLSWPEEYVRLTRGGGGGLSLVSPRSGDKCGKACCGCGQNSPGGLWFMNPLCAMAGLPVMCWMCLMCCPIELGRDYFVAYDATGAPLGAQFVRPGQNCCKTADPWLELGATPVAARRDLVAAVVALKCTDTAAYFQPQGGY